MFKEHKWQIQLVVWATVVALVTILLIKQCGHRTSDDGCSNGMADSLQLVDLPQCQRVDYRGFRVYYDSAAHLPRCVMYELTAQETQGTEPRVKGFERDDSVRGCAEPSAFRGSGLSRGHMAPAGDMKWDAEAMRQSFLMTNICPQDNSLNEGGWNRLEEKAREWARRDGALVIAAGPVIEPGLERTAGGVVIPKRFYKVILAHRVWPRRAVAFIYPNAPSNGSLRKYVVSVDSVERLTGIDLFAVLPDDQEERLERSSALASFLHVRW